MNSRICIQEDRWFVSDIVENYKPPTEDGGDKDITVPNCQREWAWKHKRGQQKMSQLIDSVMNGYPVPTCILNRVRTRKYEIYDGRHRFETLYRFANDRCVWNGRKFSELSEDEKTRFFRREIPVTIMIGATPEQLADVFIRLNKGVALKDYDLFWAMRSTPLVSATERLVFDNTQLSDSLGGISLRVRSDLAHWVALVRGLNTRNAGNMSTSHIRASENDGMSTPIDDEFVSAGLSALATLYSIANERFPTTNTEKAKLKKIGKISAFFLAEWMPADDKYAVIIKWVDVIGRLRATDTINMALALATTGAQNLTAERVARVLDQVTVYLRDGILPGAQQDDSDEDDA
jgi:hypothetical protein